MEFGLSSATISMLGSLSALVSPPPKVSSPMPTVVDHGCFGRGCSSCRGSRCFSLCALLRAVSRFGTATVVGVYI